MHMESCYCVYMHVHNNIVILLFVMIKLRLKYHRNTTCVYIACDHDHNYVYAHVHGHTPATLFLQKFKEYSCDKMISLGSIRSNSIINIITIITAIHVHPCTIYFVVQCYYNYVHIATYCD